MHRHEVKVVVPTGRKDYVIRWLDPLTGQLRQTTTGTSNRRKAERMAQEKMAELKTQAPGAVRGEPHVEKELRESLGATSQAGRAAEANEARAHPDDDVVLRGSGRG